MRELTLDECSFASGGHSHNHDCGWGSSCNAPTDPGDVIVIGGRGGGSGGDSGPPNDDGGGGGGLGSGGDDGGRDYDACEDRRADTLAAQLNQELATKPDHKRIEYGALIYRDANGELQRTQLLAGTSEKWTAMEGKTPADFGLTSWSQVVGLFHHHPTENLINGQWVDVTTPPYSASNFDRPSSGDWLTVFDFINRNEADLDNFTIHLSFNGVVKEFDAFDNQSEPRDTSVPMGGHGTESGDYNPGAQCP